MLLLRMLFLSAGACLALIAIVPLVVPSLRHECGQAARWGVTIGAAAFLAGFVGPMFYASGNLGPLLGIFFTGPLGFVIGTVGGFVISAVCRRRQKRRA